MASPTLAELAKRVEALEAENSRLKALGDPAAGGVLLDDEAFGLMRDAFEVRSELTGAVVGRHDSYETAGDECDRLNDQARREGVRHLGERMSYEVVKVRVRDEDAARERRITELKRHIDDKEYADVRDRLIIELDEVEGAVNDG